MLIEELLLSLPKGGEETQDAALILGLFLEREKVRFAGNSDGGITEILGEELAKRRLSKTEFETIVDFLIAYVDEKGTESEPIVVWALVKSYESRIFHPLLNLFEQTFDKSDFEHLACQALGGLVTSGGMKSDIYRERTIAAFRKAAQQGYGSVRETALDYLEVQRLKTL